MDAGPPGDARDRPRGRWDARRDRQDRRVRAATASTSAAIASTPSCRRSSASGSETLGDELLTRPRLSRIYFGERFFNYPLRAEDVVRGLGLIESARCALSYLAARLAPRDGRRSTFEDWVVERFGRRLYDAFFRSYTEKVWGIPGSEIQAEWAAQRIQSFCLLQALLGVLGLRRGHAHDPDRGVHVPEARSRADVGGVRAAGRGAGRAVRAQPPVRRRPS